MTDPPTLRTVARPVANLGNTCYMNAVLQALAHAPELCLAMDCEAHRSSCPIAAEKKEKNRRSSSPDGSASSSESMEAKRRTAGTRKSRRSGRRSPPDSINLDEKFCALCELEEHLELVHDSSKRDKPVAPISFVHGFIERVAPWFRLGVQEDSHEFLRLLIDAMQKSCEKARPQEDYHGATRIEDDKDSAPDEKGSSSRDSEGTEYPFSLFRGTVESTVTCGVCQHSSSTLDPIEDIGLEVASPGPPAPSRSGSERISRNASPVPAPALYDVETAFHRYSRAEALDSAYKCEKCGNVGKATKQSRLASIPPILTLHLKRFRYGGGVEPSRRSQRSELGQLLGNGDFAGKSGSTKIEGHCKFNVLFDLQPFLTQELQEKHSNMLCRLFAVIVHAGKNSHSGHYIAFVRNLAKNEWWKMDDGRVTHVSISEVQRAEAYMLFYRVVQHPVATRLEQDYRNKMENKNFELENSQINKEIAGTSSFDSSSPKNDFSALRKRPLMSIGDGETWFRTKTSMPPYLMGVIRTIEEKIAEDAMLRGEEFVKHLQEGFANANSGTSMTPTGKDAVNAVIEKYRVKVLPAIVQALKWMEREKGVSSSQLLMTRAMATPDTIATATADDKRVAVVEPAVVEFEEELDLL